MLIMFMEIFQRALELVGGPRSNCWISTPGPLALSSAQALPGLTLSVRKEKQHFVVDFRISSHQ